MPAIARYFARRGYTAVIQDVRGKFRSGGETEFGLHEVDDGFDTLEWIAAQPWCDGRVVMWGDSYFGMTQLAAAASGHPALAAISPRLTGTRLGRDVTFPDGSRDVEVTSRKGYFASWYVDRDAYEWEIDWTARPLRSTFEDFFAALGRRSANFDAEFAGGSERLQGPALDRLLAAPPVPMLFTVGLFDNCAPYSWHDLRELLAHDAWRELVHLRLEALDHENIHVDDSPAVPPGPTPDALAKMLDPTLDFFDAVLSGRRSEIPPVHYETCGGETRTASSLAAGGRARGRAVPGPGRRRARARPASPGSPASAGLAPRPGAPGPFGFAETPSPGSPTGATCRRSPRATTSSPSSGRPSRSRPTTPGRCASRSDWRAPCRRRTCTPGCWTSPPTAPSCSSPRARCTSRRCHPSAR